MSNSTNVTTVTIPSIEVMFFDTLPIIVQKIKALGYDESTAIKAARKIYVKGTGMHSTTIRMQQTDAPIPIPPLKRAIEERQTLIESELAAIDITIDEASIEKISNSVTFVLPCNKTNRELFEHLKLSSDVPFACFKDRVRINSASSFLAAAAFQQFPGRCICAQRHAGPSLSDTIRVKISRKEVRFMFRGPNLTDAEFYVDAEIKIDAATSTCEVLVLVDSLAEQARFAKVLAAAIGQPIMQGESANLNISYNFPNIQKFNTVVMDDLVMNNPLVSRIYRVNDRKSAISRYTMSYRLYVTDEKTKSSTGPSFVISRKGNGTVSVNFTAMSKKLIRPHIKLIAATLKIYQKHEQKIEESYNAILPPPAVSPYFLASARVSDEQPRRGREVDYNFVVRNTANSKIRAEMVDSVGIAMQQTWIAPRRSLEKFINSNRRMDAGAWAMALAAEFRVSLIIFTDEGIKIPEGKEGLYFQPPYENYALIYEKSDGTMDLLAKLDDLFKTSKSKTVLSSVTKLKPGKIGRLPAYMDIFGGQIARVGIPGEESGTTRDPNPILHCLEYGDEMDLFLPSTDPNAKIAAKANNAACEWKNGQFQTNHRKTISGCNDAIDIVDQFVGKNGKLRGFGMRLRDGQIVDVLALQPVCPLYDVKLRNPEEKLRRKSKTSIRQSIHTKFIMPQEADAPGIKFKKCNTPCIALSESSTDSPFETYRTHKRYFSLLLQVVLHKFSASLNDDDGSNTEIDPQLINNFLDQHVEETKNIQTVYKENLNLNFPRGKIKVPTGSRKSIIFFLKSFIVDPLFVRSFKNCSHAVDFFDNSSRSSRDNINFSCEYNDAWSSQTLQTDPLYHDKPLIAPSDDGYWL